MKASKPEVIPQETSRSLREPFGEMLKGIRSKVNLSPINFFCDFITWNVLTKKPGSFLRNDYGLVPIPFNPDIAGIVLHTTL